MPGPFSTVLFDLDDTLLDSLGARVKALEAVFSHTGIRHLRAEQFLHDLQGSPFEYALDKLEKEQNIQIKLFQTYRCYYWTKEPGTLKLYPGVRTMLDELSSKGVRLGIVTQKPRTLEIEGYSAGVVQELNELGVADLFSVIVGFDDVIEHKPHPECINLALGTLGSEPEETLVVGDSAADMEAARAAGCFSCYSIWGIPENEHKLDNIRADLVAETPEILLELNYL
ncbi:HAD family hydrolase [Chloroflexota bacterium]